MHVLKACLLLEGEPHEQLRGCPHFSMVLSKYECLSSWCVSQGRTWDAEILQSGSHSAICVRNSTVPLVDLVCRYLDLRVILILPITSIVHVIPSLEVCPQPVES